MLFAQKYLILFLKNLMHKHNVIQVYPTITTSTETASSADLQHQLDDDIHDAPPEGEKRVKRHKASKSSKSAREETVIDEDEATLNDALSNQFKNADEYAYHLEQTTNFMENQIVWESRQEDIRRPVPRPLVFFRPQRNPNEPLRIRMIWERVHDFQLRIKIYQIKVNLNAPTLTFSGIKAYEPYSIVDKPSIGLIYLNSKDEKQVMYLVEIMKFCNATLEKVLKEVMLKIFQSEPWKKPPLLGELDHDIIRAFEREITKCLSHREQKKR
ncbi:hypothetical protein Tco_0385760 [Tanacetum coccineum]